MKCPGCSAQFSDLRDVCPSCLSDLRSFKRQNGIPVSYPAASLESLVRKLQKEQGASDTGKSSVPPGNSSVRTEKTEYPAAVGGIDKPAFQTSTSIMESAQLSDDPDDPNDAVEIALRELLQREYVRQQGRFAGEGETFDITPSDSESESEEVSETSPGPEASEAEAGPDGLPEIELDEPFIEVESDSLESVSESSYLNISASESEVEIGRPPQLEKLVEPDAGTSPAPPAEEDIPEPAIFTFPDYAVRETAEAPDISELYEEVLDSSNGDRAEIELSLYQIAGMQDSERIKLLFSLADESLCRPEKDFSFLLDPTITRNSGMELVQLQKATEHLVFKTPTRELPPLRSQQRKLAAHRASPAPLRQAQLRKRIPLRHATLGERAVAFLVDFICMILLGLGAGMVVSLAATPDFDRFMVQLLSAHPLSIMHILRMSCAGTGLMVVLYPLLSLLLTGTTLGLSMLRITLETEEADPPGPANIIVRSCTFPLTMILIGPLPIFPGERFFHDYAAGVVAGRRE